MIELFENEQNEEVKSSLAEILIDLNEDCVLPYILDVAETDKDPKQRAWAAATLVKFEIKVSEGIIIGLLKKNKIDKHNFAFRLWEINTSFSRYIISVLEQVDNQFFHEINWYKDRIKRQKAFLKTWFASRTDQIYEGISCGAMNECLPYALFDLVRRHPEELENVFVLWGNMPNLHYRFLLARDLLKVDFERALGCLIHLVENTSYENVYLAATLLNLNHPKGIEAFFKKPNLPYDIKGVINIQTPMARKLISLLIQKKKEWKDYIQQLNPSLKIPD